MADPLSLLRQYNVSKKDIIEKNDYICFGESCWPKNVKTNYLSYGSSRDGPNKDFYTLECLYFFLRNKEMQHPAYVRQAAAQGVPVVRRPDRKDLLAYLTGESATSQSIDRSAPLELPIPLHEIQAKFGKDDDKGPVGSLGKLGSGDSTGAEAAEDENESDPKKLKVDSKHFLTEAKKQFSDRLDAPKIKKSELIDAAGGQTAAGLLGLRGIGSAASSSATSLKEALTLEQIASLKAKRMAKKRMTIIDAENEFEKDGAILTGTGTAAPTSSLTGPSSILFKYDASVTREIQSKERVWRNRSTILVSTGKNFAKSIFPIIQAIKVREEGSSAINQRKPPGNIPMGAGYSNSQMNGSNMNQMVSRIPNSTPMGGNSMNPNMPPPNMMTTQQYNRYDQERFNRSAPSNEFRIDTTGSYHGFNLKNVTDIGPNSNLNDSANSPGLNHPSTPALSKVLSSIPSPMTSVMNQSPGSAGKKRTSKTPIIIIPSTTTSLITLANAKSILQDLKFIESNAGEMPRDNEILIQRRKQGEITTVPYRVINNILKLGEGDWDRVVAVFVQGPAWQFKGWPWEGNPVDIFSRIKAFHIKWDEMKLDSNVSKWNVEVIQLSRNKRHLDRANLLKFWSSLDTFMNKNKNYLRF
ncbi:parafibromin-like [Panonychus citri]|uniref:parafibromin-like n=1 Tax=Panonychus citri TaxID=50023 RepID=UPI0023077FCA|nr:parafibromin-like [Panonychus citri]